MINAKQLKKQAEKNKEERFEQLNKDLKDFLIQSEEKLLRAAGNGETCAMFRLPFDFLEMDTNYLQGEITKFYTHYGYKISFPRCHSSNYIPSARIYIVSWGCV